ncbi:MAG: tetratricopeptide repeat protein, partial [Rhodopirellula sp. JB055]|uniref:tetratricopeptide repeat protein n=1 Tax=Rhodopirellula sp. JB055 TaxID=3342846 RepID=UPI00370CD8A4
AHLRSDSDQVIRLLASDNVLTQSHDDLEPAVLLGLALHQRGRTLEAADVIEKASLLGPITDEARIALASCYAQLRRTDLARELYLELALSRRLDAGLMLKVAAGLAAIDSPQLAMKVCEWITEKDDTVGQAYYDMGVYSARCGNALYLTEALTRRAIQLDSGNVHFRVGLASLLIQLQRDDEALEVVLSFEKTQLQQATCFSCLQQIADLLTRHQQLELATECQKRSNELRAERAANATL